MKVRLHMPRKSEADVTPAVSEDVTIKPRFYQRQGLQPLFYITTINAHNHEERHVVMINATHGRLRLERLVEVIPACDEPARSKDKDKDKEPETPPQE